MYMPSLPSAGSLRVRTLFPFSSPLASDIMSLRLKKKKKKKVHYIELSHGSKGFRKTYIEMIRTQVSMCFL